MKCNRFGWIVLPILMVFSSAVYADTADLEKKLDQLEQEMAAIKAQIAEQKITQQAQVDSAVKAAVASASMVVPAPPPPAEAADTSIGGYGELSYSNYRNSAGKNQIDFNRFVMLMGHQFNDKLRMYSELEIEHAVASATDKGEIEVEQAYIEYSLLPQANLRTGLVLIPLGILNETHEPPTYYGVFRNEVETRIIPTTWREAGVALQGKVLDSALEYNVGISSGFDATKYNGDASYAIRDMHGEASYAAANNLAAFAGVNYHQPGWLLGAGLFTGNTAQNGNGSGTTLNNSLQGKDARLTLWDVHTQYSTGNLELQALYARGTLGNTLAINTATGILPGGILDAAPRLFYGWYGQVAYHVWQKDDMRLTPFVRYERYNTQASVDPGYTANPLNSDAVVTLGANFNLMPEVVFKADWQRFSTNTGQDRFDLGAGYMF